MSQRTTMIVAASITAFILVLGGGLVSRLSATAEVQDQAALKTSQTAISPDPTVQALLRDREVARLSLERANERLRESARQLSELQQVNDKLSQSGPQQPDRANPDKEPVELVGRDQAIATATAYLGGGKVKEVELEREHGVTAYEIEFTNGSTVYVDAGSGEVAYAKTKGGDRHDDD